MSRVENQMSLSLLGWRALMDRKAAKPGQCLTGERYTNFLTSHTHTQKTCELITCHFSNLSCSLLYSVNCLTVFLIAF